MREGALLIGFVTLERLVELIFAQRNTKRLLVRGGVEFGRSHYPLIVAVHGAWLGGLWALGRNHPVDLAWLALFGALQLGRLWVIATLGRRWTTRVVVVPGETLVTSGPYRFVPHPNYLIVLAEIVVVPLALGLPLYAALFGVLNGALLIHRVRIEEAALESVRAGPPNRLT